MTDPIYLDYNATTPLDPAVLDAMLPYLRTHFGNPSSDHIYGYRARQAVATAREQLAALLGAEPDEVIVTGGGSEANNLALFGIAATRGTRGNHIVTSTIEHPAVREPLRALEYEGYRVTAVPVDQDGRVDPAQVLAAFTAETILISIMHANNEVGTLQDLRAIAELAHARDILVHTDAAQSVGKLTFRECPERFRIFPARFSPLAPRYRKGLVYLACQAGAQVNKLTYTA